MADDKTSETEQTTEEAKAPLSTAPRAAPKRPAKQQATGDAQREQSKEETAPAPVPYKLMRFRANQKSPTLELNNGDYFRKFVADEQPFAVADETEFQLLKRSGFFVEDKETEKDEEA